MSIKKSKKNKSGIISQQEKCTTQRRVPEIQKHQSQKAEISNSIHFLEQRLWFDQVGLIWWARNSLPMMDRPESKYTRQSIKQS
jgi:hypothetical protein